MSDSQASAQPPSPLEPDLTPDEIVSRATAMRPRLIELQAETEEKTRYSEETHEAFKDAGFYRILVPRMFGGYEFGIDTFFRVTVELSRACASTGWMYTLGSSHAHTLASHWPEEAQREIFGDGHFICPATVRPEGKATRNEDGSWTMDGDFHYCSGSPYGTHFMSHTFMPADGDSDEPPQQMMFVASRDEWTLLDDWGELMGLKGSGSNSIRFENGQIPAHWVREGATLLAPEEHVETVGAALHNNTMYQGSSLSFFLLEFASMSVGMALNALDVYEELMERPTPLPSGDPSRRENADYQRWFGQATGKITCAERALWGLIDEWIELAAKGGGSIEDDLRTMGVCREIGQLCWTAVQEHCFRTAGSSALHQDGRVVRIFRDSAQLHGHSAISFFHDTGARALANIHFAAAAQ